MTLNDLSDRATGVAIRGGLAVSHVLDALEARVPRHAVLRADGERGSQTAEYALVGGVAAAAAATLITIITKGDWLKMIVTAIVKALTEFIAKWFF